MWLTRLTIALVAQICDSYITLQAVTLGKGSYDAIQCDTIYGIFTFAQMLAQEGQLHLAHGTKTQNKEKTKNKIWLAQKKRSGW